MVSSRAQHHVAMLVVIMCFFFPIWHVVPLELELAHICHVSIGARRGHSFKREEWRQQERCLLEQRKPKNMTNEPAPKRIPGNLSSFSYSSCVNHRPMIRLPKIISESLIRKHFHSIHLLQGLRDELLPSASDASKGRQHIPPLAGWTGRLVMKSLRIIASLIILVV